MQLQRLTFLTKEQGIVEGKSSTVSKWCVKPCIATVWLKDLPGD